MKNGVFCLLLVGGLVLGCGQKQSRTSNGRANSNGKIQAVATVGMVAELVRNVGGEHVEVRQICGSGVDPHGYLPSRDDVQDIMDAEVIFYCGLMLEGKMIDTLEQVGKSKPAVAVTDAIARQDLLFGGDPNSDGQGHSNHSDPHLWNDVSLWSRCLNLVRDELMKLDPDHAKQYAANASAYQSRLAELHQYGIKAIATIPRESRLLVTSHDAFSYFGRAYGLDVTGIQGVSTESEAGLQQINGLVDLLIKRDVKSVFIESSVSPKNVEALIEGAQSRGHQVSKGGMLFSDAMGAEGTYEGTYIGMLDHNLTTAARALGGVVDEGGFQGKLAGAKRER